MGLIRKDTKTNSLVENKCPECIDKGSRSCLYLSDKWITEIGTSEKYYDEDGKLHYHNTRTYEGTWKCSQNHEGRYYEYHSCGICRK